MRMNIRMKTTVKKADLLDTLRLNAEKHSAIVAEAKKGYVQKAREALSAKLDELAGGKVVSVYFGLHMPQDHSDVYRNAISMLEWNTADEVELDAEEFRNLVRDEWEWKGEFLANNRDYSATARAELEH